MRARDLSNPGGYFATKVEQREDGSERRRYIAREAVCECGTRFVQKHLSAAFLELCEKWNHGGAMRELRKQVPDFYVPVHCPKCERQQLGLEARRSGYRLAPIADVVNPMEASA